MLKLWIGFKKLQIKESPEAQANLGMMYNRGDGVPKDETKGASLCRKAADGGNAFAQHCLGAAYEYGSGVEKNPLKAKDLYLKASAQGDGNSSLSLFMMYEGG